jgi:hypothetical protein
VVRGTKHRCTIFQARVGPVQIAQKGRQDTLHQNCVFASGGISGKRNEFWCVRGCETLTHNFHARVARYRFHKKSVGTRYTELVLLHLVESACHTVHSGVSGARNVDTLFSWIGGPDADSTKSMLAHITPNICFCIRWDLRVT